jgi:hypothetical protein
MDWDTLLKHHTLSIVRHCVDIGKVDENGANPPIQPAAYFSLYYRRET